MSVTKRRESGGDWAVLHNGEPTNLVVTKGEAADAHRRLTHAVMLGAEFLFEARTVGKALQVIEIIMAEGLTGD